MPSCCLQITTELFVKVANMLSKLGQQVDVEPILCMDPLRHELHHHHLHLHNSRDNSPKNAAKPEANGIRAHMRQHFTPTSADDAV